MLVHLQGVRSFHAWPQCKDIRNLNTHIGEWLKAQARFAAQMPPEHLREYFTSILPEDLKQEVLRRRNDLPALNDVINFVQEEINRANDQRLSAMHMQNRQKLLGGKSEAFAGSVTQEAGQQLVAKLTTLVNAVASQRGRDAQRGNRKPGSRTTSPARSQSPSTCKGCHHCSDFSFSAFSGKTSVSAFKRCWVSESTIHVAWCRVHWMLALR